MEKEYVRINRETYNNLANEYNGRNYAVDDDFYKNVMFKELDFKPGKRILEIGPGRGARLKNFVDYGMDVTAIELSSAMADIVRSKVPEANIINKNVLECKFDCEFDFIYMEAVIHNFPKDDAEELLNLIKSWLKDGGIIICTTTVESVDSEGYEAKDDYANPEKRFRHRYTEESLFELFNKSGLRIYDKKYKEEKDEKRNKMWQIIYAQKD